MMSLPMKIGDLDEWQVLGIGLYVAYLVVYLFAWKCFRSVDDLKSIESSCPRHAIKTRTIEVSKGETVVATKYNKNEEQKYEEHKNEGEEAARKGPVSKDSSITLESFLNRMKKAGCSVVYIKNQKEDIRHISITKKGDNFAIYKGQYYHSKSLPAHRPYIEIPMKSELKDVLKLDGAKNTFVMEFKKKVYIFRTKTDADFQIMLDGFQLLLKSFPLSSPSSDSYQALSFSHSNSNDMSLGSGSGSGSGSSAAEDQRELASGTIHNDKR